MKKLSIVTICYNEPDVAKTCESIVKQSWQDFEWIVIDGGSNKETLDTFGQYKNRIDKFVSEPDDGIYYAMNKGINLASGEYILFLNAGDFLRDENVLKNAISQKLDKDIVCGCCEFVKPGNKTGKLCTPPHNTIDFAFLIAKSLPHPASFIKRELFCKYGLYSLEYKIVSDWEKWIVFLHVNKCSYKHIDTICTVFNTGGLSSSSANMSLQYQEREAVIKKYFTDKQIKEAKAYRYSNYSLVDNIFSIKNSIGRTHKVVTIFGIHIKIRKKR